MGRRIQAKEATESPLTSASNANVNGKDSIIQPTSHLRASDLALWTPRFETAVSMLLLPRMVSAIVNPIADCDETFNYWEPLHFLLNHFGLQTWEYSPVYALRSYLYLQLCNMLGNSVFFGLALVSPAHTSKTMFFYSLRGAFALVSAYCEALLYQQCAKTFGNRIGRYFLWILFWNAGVFHASTAFLPSTFAMYLIMLVITSWMSGYHFTGIFCGVVAVLCGWPYVGVLFVPFMLDTFAARGMISSLLAGGIIATLVLVAEVTTNYEFYQRLVLPAWNIVKYNVLSSETDSTLYGTEPWTYYVLNLFLNFNVVALLALPALMWLLLRQRFRLALYLSPMYIWLIIMFCQAHKEERFMFPIYPLICLAAAVTLDGLHEVLSHRVLGSCGRVCGSLLIGGSLTVFSLLSVSRMLSVTINYGAPLRLYQHLHDNVLPHVNLKIDNVENPVTICVAKEWHRFPTSFFLPGNASRLVFLKSEFNGQLPKPFEEHEHGTSVIPRYMNDQNREEPTRYGREQDCDYVVDLNLQHQKETKYWEQPEKWQKIHSEWFLDASNSPNPFRAFYIPLLTPQKVTYVEYALYQRVVPQERNQVHPDTNIKDDDWDF